MTDPSSEKKTMGKITLSIMGVNFEIEGPAELLAGTKEVYGPYFDSNAQGASFIIKVHSITSPSPQGLLNQRESNENVYHYYLDDSYYEIDLEEQRAIFFVDNPSVIHKLNYGIIQVLSHYAVNHGGVLLHAAAVEKDGRVYIFLGHSGSGKSTVARLSTGLRILNDDIVGVLPGPIHHTWMAYPTPFWSPKQTPPSPITTPGQIDEIFILKKDTSIFLRKLTYVQSIATLTSSISILAVLPDHANRILPIAEKLCRTIPLKELHFTKDGSFWNVILQGTQCLNP